MKIDIVAMCMCFPEMGSKGDFFVCVKKNSGKNLPLFLLLVLVQQ